MASDYNQVFFYKKKTRCPDKISRAGPSITRPEGQMRPTISLKKNQNIFSSEKTLFIFGPGPNFVALDKYSSGQA